MNQANKKNLPKEPGGHSGNPGFRAYVTALQAHQKNNGKKNEASVQSASTASCDLQVIEKDGVIDKIKVTCKCGELIEIDCGYTEK